MYSILNNFIIIIIETTEQHNHLIELCCLINFTLTLLDYKVHVLQVQYYWYSTTGTVLQVQYYRYSTTGTVLQVQYYRYSITGTVLQVQYYRYSTTGITVYIQSRK